MDFYGLVEEWPDESFVVFRELPGCFSSSPTTEDAIKKAPEAIVEYFRWLKQNDITILDEEVDSINVVVRERLQGNNNGPPRFEADLTMKLFENAMDYEIFLRNLTPEQRVRVYHHGVVEYTAAKALRRMCEHLREHFPWMQAIALQVVY